LTSQGASSKAEDMGGDEEMLISVKNISHKFKAYKQGQMKK
jgi:hypothetical protein